MNNIEIVWKTEMPVNDYIRLKGASKKTRFEIKVNIEDTVVSTTRIGVKIINSLYAKLKIFAYETNYIMDIRK